MEATADRPSGTIAGPHAAGTTTTRETVVNRS